ncbi:MAG: 30S ribosome-binding factor RbfA [Chloroflexi bacterium]|nr:30S ribosome-binding factor RbfA [Chloroflexota bacterium]
MPHRIEHINSLIRQELSELLQRQVKDPRLGNFIAITEVSVSADLKYARVFVTHLGGEAEKEKILGALASAAGFFRRELAKRLKLRNTPELSFRWDDSIERGEHLLQLLDRIDSGTGEPKASEN